MFDAIVGSPIMVWKGVEGDSGIYWSTFSGGSWGAQKNFGGVGTSDRPAVGADPITGTPRLVWKLIAGDHALYTSTLRGLFWQPQEEVAWIVAGNGGLGTVGIGRPGSELGPSVEERQALFARFGFVAQGAAGVGATRG